jgi:hypothetical protein
MENSEKDLKAKCSNKKCSFLEYYSKEEDKQNAKKFWFVHACPFCKRTVNLIESSF